MSDAQKTNSDGGDGNNAGKPPSGPPVGLALLPLDTVHLQEMLLWCRLAGVFIDQHPQEVKRVMQDIIPMGRSIVLQDVDIVFTLSRLKDFILALQEALHELRVVQAQAEAAIVVGEGKLN